MNGERVENRLNVNYSLLCTLVGHVAVCQVFVRLGGTLVNLLRSCFVFLILSLFACSASAADLTGSWKGRWTAAGKVAREHSGTLRMRLRPVGPGHYKALFAGRFAVVIPYAYRADVSQSGSSITSTRRLGPMGEYSMRLEPISASQLSGRWSAMGQGGKISLRRR